jgi:hypothetical protein
MASKDSVDGACYADCQPLDTTDESRRPVCFDQEMHMVDLDAKLEEAKARSGRCGQGRTHDCEKAPFAEGWDAGLRTQRHVNRAADFVGGPPAMWHRAASRPRWTAGTTTRPAPGSEGEIELPCAPRHLEWGRYYTKLARMSRDCSSRRRFRCGGQALRSLRERRLPLVIDDFHYIARELQGQITRILKPLVFEGVPVLYLAIPHRRFDAVKVEREMNGRVEIVHVPAWDIRELSEIPQLGFPLLNITPDTDTSVSLATEAQGSPHLMQEFCKKMCLESGVSETSVETRMVNAEFDYARIFRSVAGDLGKNIFDRLARGPRTRTDRKPRRLKSGRQADIYRVVLIGLAELRPGVETVEYEPLRASIRNVLIDALPQAHEVSRVLEQMAKISSTDESSVPVIDYERDERKLHVTDPFFAFFLRWGRELIDA